VCALTGKAMKPIAWHRAGWELVFIISMKTAEDFDKQNPFPLSFGSFKLQDLEQKSTRPSRN